MCVSVCAICYVTQLVKGQFFLLSISVSKTVCPAFCNAERCSKLDGHVICCDSKCAAGCAGVTESHCVVSVNGGGSEGRGGGGRVFKGDVEHMHCCTGLLPSCCGCM